MSKFLDIRELDNPGRKTRSFEVSNKAGNLLGFIHFYTGWRRYVFSTIGSHIVLDPACMYDLANFMRDLTQERNPQEIKVCQPK